MILKGNQRGGGQQLAAHLLNSFDNERVEVADVRGSVAQDLSGAFAEWAAEARGTKCSKNLYSLSLNPDQAQGHLNREQYLDLLERTERSLKLVGQPRAVVFHEKRDKDGVLREHCHAIWSRIDTEHMKAVQISHDRLKLRTVAREFARDYGLELPDGMKPANKKDRFNDRAKQENLGEKQQQERTGIDKAGRMEEIAACWTTTKTGAEFVRAMEDKGYYLARGDQRTYVVIDLYGEIHSLSRQIGGVAKKKELMDRLSGHPPDKQPNVESARAYARQKLQERQKALEKGSQEAIGGRQADEGNLLKQAQEPSRQEAMGAKATEGNLLQQRREALVERQQQRRAELDKQRTDLFARQFSERGALREMQAAGNTGVDAARLEKQPKGLAAFLTRITGIGNLVSWVKNKADAIREATQKRQTETLLRRHDRELKEMDRHYHALDPLEARENRAADNAVQREGYRKLRVRTFELKPEFDKALARQDATTATGGGAQKLSALFSRLAEGIGFTKGDLQAAFERATAGKTVRTGDTDTKGPAPADPEKLEKARKLRDELNRPPRPGPDRDRER
jgi:hypothetical protein